MRRKTAKNQTPEQKIDMLISEIEREIQHWKDMKEHGCSDPFCCDGLNMNLTRNHILYYKNQIYDLCIENEILIPDIVNVPTPPKVNNTYMADLNCDRANNFRRNHEKITHDNVEYDEAQLSML